jgi:hypothetical protein
MSDTPSDNLETDPSLAPPTVELAEAQPGSVHVVLSIPTQDAAPEPAPPPPARPNEATEVAGAVVGGAAKLVGKVLGGVWDVVKPRGDS